MHATGAQVVYLHTPSGSLIAGDTFTNTGQPAALGMPPPRMPSYFALRLPGKNQTCLSHTIWHSPVN